MGIFGREDKKDQCAVGNEPFGDLLVVGNNGIGPRGIDHGDLF